MDPAMERHGETWRDLKRHEETRGDMRDIGDMKRYEDTPFWLLIPRKRDLTTAYSRPPNVGGTH